MEEKTFREAYGMLQAHARALREQTEPNIDDLLSIVTESVAAYKVCKRRIDAVEKALQEALTDLGGDVGTRAAGAAADDDASEAPSPAPRRAPTRGAPRSSTGFEDMDDDTPFKPNPN